MTPRVSVCVPNLNTRPFLDERFQTIAAQTFRDWELLVYDSYSTDGAWEFIQEVAAREPRLRAWQGPRQGTPGSWTPCIREARGEYVYIATSDDTMPPDCLEKLVAALDAHPDCDIAHCRLKPIDHDGREVTAKTAWWTRGSTFALSSGPLIDRPHVRRAPFDGLLHLLGGSVYVSITQLLIRRSLFDRIGHFESTWGSIGDFHWAMRAGLVANTVHVPDTWGGWRLHAAQATAQVSLASTEHARKVDDMIDRAIEACGDLLPPARLQQIALWARHARDARAFSRDVAIRQRPHRRYRFIASRMLGGSAAAREHVSRRLLGRPSSDWLRQRLEKAGYPQPLISTQ